MCSHEHGVITASCCLHNRLILQLSSQQCRYQPVLCVSHTQLSTAIVSERKYRTIFSHAHGVSSTRSDLQHFPALQLSSHQRWHYSAFNIPNTQLTEHTIAAHKYQPICSQTRSVLISRCDLHDCFGLQQSSHQHRHHSVLSV